MKHEKVFMIAFVLGSIPFLNQAQGAIEYYSRALNPQDQALVDQHLQMLSDEVTYYVVNIHPEAFLQSEVLVNFPPGIQDKMLLQRVTKYNDRDYSVRGGRDQKNTYALTYVNGSICGSFRSKLRSWTVKPLRANLQIIYPHSALRFACGQPEELDVTESRDQLREDIDSTLKTASTLMANCHVRLLVMYTANSDTSSGMNIMTVVRSAVDHFNTSNSNSEVNFQVELARVVRTAYEETGDDGGAHFEDLERFHDIEDGYMDIVDNYRDAYDADMCILFITNLPDDFLGEAWTIGASYEDAFAISLWTSDLAFTHEFGHLLGCKHDTYTLTHGVMCHENLEIPTGCAHGYVNLTEGNEFATIMSYTLECDCEDISCGHIEHWSNPDVTFGGEPTGTGCNNPLARENNAAKLNDDYDIQASHEPYVAHKTWDYTGELEHEVIEEREYGDLLGEFTLKVAENSTTTYKVQAGGEAQFRAGERITFYPGFTARSGSTAHAFLESCNDISNLTENGPVVSREFFDENTGEPEFSVSADIDSVHATMNITCIVGVDADISLDLYDSNDNKALTLLRDAHTSCGKYVFKKNIPDPGKGPFELQMTVVTDRFSKQLKMQL